jgi:mRNA interferase YafQ
MQKTKLTIEFTTKMKKDAKRMEKQGRDMSKLANILSMLANCEKLPQQNHDHRLKGDKKDFRECHIESDWLLIYQIFEERLVLSAVRTGTHTDLLGF